jgi:predicted PurR-regulated permease PerM
MHSDLKAWTIRGIGLALGVLVVVAVVQVGIAAGGVLLLVFVSVLLASALSPIVGWLRDTLPLGRVGAIAVVYLLFILVMLAMAFIVLPAAVNQAGRIVAQLPPFFEEVRGWAANLRPVALSTSITALVDSVEAAFAPAPPPSGDEVVEVGATVAEAALSFFTLLAIVFFWLLEHARLQRYALAYLPAHRRAGARGAWNEIENRLGLWVRGQLILMAAMGVATGTAYTLLGLPGALLLGLIAALTEAIPIVGPLLGAIPAVLVAATVSPELAVVVAIIYVILQLLEGSVLVPMVMRHTIGISPLLVLVSLLVGGAAGGIVGAFLGVPVAAAIEIVLSRLQARETPVAQDAASIATIDDDTADDLERSLPDAKKPGARRTSRRAERPATR